MVVKKKLITKRLLAIVLTQNLFPQTLKELFKSKIFVVKYLLRFHKFLTISLTNMAKHKIH